MLMTYFFVGMAFALPELVVVENLPRLKKFLRKNPIFELVFSLSLGIVMAWAMGITAGAMIAIGNVFSTAITICWYKIDPIIRYKKMRASVQSTWSKVQSIVDLFHYIFLPFTTIMKGLRQVNLYLRRTK